VIVVDASCIVEVLLGTEVSSRIERRWRDEGALHAPEVVDLEVLQVLRRLLASRELSKDRAVLAASAFERLALRRWSHAPLRRRVWALRDSLTAYDAAYTALAERLRCPLLTRDARLARAKGHRADVEVVT
jgi:predicted nucleic acid-binding protein